MIPTLTHDGDDMDPTTEKHTAKRRPRSEVQADLERKLLRMRWQGPRSALRGLDHLKKELLEIAETCSEHKNIEFHTALDAINSLRKTINDAIPKEAL